MNPTPAPALRQKYADLTKVANDLGIINFLIAEQGGKLQLTGTAAYQLAVLSLGLDQHALLDDTRQSAAVHVTRTPAGVRCA